MNISKTVTSRNGNVYNLDLFLTGREIHYVIVKDIDGKEIYVGSGGVRDSYKYSRENYLVESIQDIILYVEENYGNYGALKSFEEWDGKII